MSMDDLSEITVNGREFYWIVEENGVTHILSDCFDTMFQINSSLDEEGVSLILRGYTTGFDTGARVGEDNVRRQLAQVLGDYKQSLYKGDY
jgi:hypothetical protein